MSFWSPFLTISLFRHVSTRTRSVRHARTCARCERSMASGTLNLCPDGESRSEWTISRIVGSRDGEEMGTKRWGQTGSSPFSRITNQYLPNEIVQINIRIRPVCSLGSENAPTAPWKSLRDFRKRPPPSLLVMTLRTDKRRRACARLGLTRYSQPLPRPGFQTVGITLRSGRRRIQETSIERQDASAIHRRTPRRSCEDHRDGARTREQAHSARLR